MGLDPEVRREIEDDMTDPGWHPNSSIRAALAALDEAEARAEKAERERDECRADFRKVLVVIARKEAGLEDA
jgi:hypothetical protein